MLVSPGPGTPEEAGVSHGDDRGLRASAPSRCSGCASATRRSASWLGATVGRAPELLHGKTSLCTTTAPGSSRGCRSPFTATRYHSLTIDPATLPDELVANGHTDSGIIMAVRHRDLPLHGVQFHPESVLTEGGHRMLANWLALCGDADAVERSVGLSPLVTAAV